MLLKVGLIRSFEIGTFVVKKRLKFDRTFGLSKPDFALGESRFLTQTENFPTGLWRALRIFMEYMRGFYTFSSIVDCVTVFGSANFHENHAYYALARTMGAVLAQGGFTVMTGGGPGIMEAANRGAREAGGRSVSCNIRLKGDLKESPNPYVDRRIELHYFFVRKVMLTKYSLAFVVMPGGFGTLDELFEMANLIRTHRVRHFPLVLMGSQYWQPLLDFIHNVLIQEGTASPSDVESIFVTDSPDVALSYILEKLMLIRGQS